ncbi:g1488 [Coccomyxa viridis]|uniref:7,8-dihydroneopterin aldolase n=1 Tax=Coccomyxa viridis TaxID=1274662 RepID=A0ABP1FPW8_9CHLO
MLRRSSALARRAVTGYQHSRRTCASESQAALVPGGSDKISLNGCIFHGFHGVLPEEKQLGQKFIVDAIIYCDVSKAGQSDALKDTVNYAAVYRDIRLVMEGKPRNLIETVATDIATNILQDYREVKGLKISVQKPHVALDGVVKSMGVEIERYRFDPDDDVL